MTIATATPVVYPFPAGSTNDQNNQTLRGTFFITAGTYPYGGLTLNWGATLTPNEGGSPPVGNTPTYLEILKVPPTSPASAGGGPLPIDCDAKSVALIPSGYVYSVDNVDGNLHILELGGGSPPNVALGELATGSTLGTGVLDDTIMFRATFSYFG